MFTRKRNREKWQIITKRQNKKKLKNAKKQTEV
jgi:hypothetical protein